MGGDEISGLAAYIRARLQAGADDLHADVVARVERMLLHEVLEHTGFNLSQAARTLGISRTTLRAKMSSLGLTLDRTTTIEEVE
jgi:DNA-binding protein Fis